MEARKTEPGNSVSAAITRGLGGKGNISDVDGCATRLRCSVHDPELVDEGILRSTGASGVLRKGKGVQIIYGPHVTVIKSELEDYLDREIEEVPEETEAGKTTGIVYLSSPITGQAAKLSTVPDEAFAQKMMGDGAAVTPEDPKVLAPEDGKVDFVFDTGHAMGFVTDSGVSLLIHVGIDTVKLNGKGFEVLVKSGQRVKKGEPLWNLDLDFLRSHAPSVITPVVCTELADNQRVRLLKKGKIRAGELLLAIETVE